MRTRTWIILAAVTLALSLALILPSFSWARVAGQPTGYRPGSATPTGQTIGQGMGMRAGQGRGQAMMGSQQMGTQQSLLAVAAEVLGISQDELLTRLQSDKSIADVAGDKTQAIIDRFVQLQSERLSSMVAAGSLTQAEADQRVAVMKGMVTGRVYQVWATGVQGPPEGMGPAQNGGQMAGRMGGHGPGNRQGAGRGAGNGSCDGTCAGAGSNYTDENGDGVCDNAGTGQGAGMRNRPAGR